MQHIKPRLRYRLKKRFEVRMQIASVGFPFPSRKDYKIIGEYRWKWMAVLNLFAPFPAHFYIVEIWK